MSPAKRSRRRVRSPRGPEPAKLRVTRCKTCGGQHVLLDGAWFRWKRESAQMDQRTFGKLAGVSGPYISDIENNRRECPVEIERVYRRLKR